MFQSSPGINTYSTTVCVKESSNKLVIKSYSVPAFYLGKRSEQMQLSVSHMNSRSGWYLIPRKTNAVLFVQQNSAKGRLFILLHLFTENVQFYQIGQKRKKKSLSNRWSFRQYSNLPIKSFEYTRPQGLFSSVRKRSSTDSCSETAMPFFCTYEMTFPGMRFTSEHERASASTDCHRKKVQVAWKFTKARTR